MIREQALKKIQIISDFLEEITSLHHPSFEVEAQDDELLLIDDSKRHFLFNYHGVTKQIWYSSAMSGAHHFTLKNDEWRCTRTDELLDTFISTELSQIFGTPIVFPAPSNS